MAYSCPCGIEKTCKHPYFKVFGNPSPEILIVGDAPTGVEDGQGKLGVGEEQLFLLSTLEGCGVNLDTVAFCNVLGCMPPNNRIPTVQQVKSCANNLKECFDSVKDSVKLVLLLGNTPLKVVAGKSGITKYRGSLIPVVIGEAKVMPIFHPGYVLRQMDTRLDTFVSDIDFAVSTMSNINPMDLIPHKAVDSMYLEEHLEEIISCDFLSVDLETTGLDGFLLEAKVLGVGLCWSENDAVFVPLYHKDCNVLSKEKCRRVKFLKLILENINVPKIGQNIKFDCVYLYATLGINIVNIVGDTMLAHHLLNENALHNLSYLTTEYIPKYRGYDAEMNYLMGVTEKRMGKIPLDKIIPYGCGDVFVVYLLHKIFRKLLEEEGIIQLYDEIVIPGNEVYTSMVKHGVKIDGDVGRKLKISYSEFLETVLSKLYNLNVIKRDWKRYREKELGIEKLKKVFTLTVCPHRDKCKKLSKKIKIKDVPNGIVRDRDNFVCLGWLHSSIYPECTGFEEMSVKRKQFYFKKLVVLKEKVELNVNSPQQLCDLFYVVGGLPQQIKFKTGNLTTDKEARESLLLYTQAQYKNILEFVAGFHDYSKVYSLYKSFINKWETWLSSDGLAHPNILQHGTVTGRLAMRNPPLQTIPKNTNDLGDDISNWVSQNNVKDMFVSKFEDGWIIDADFSQIELRVMASESGDEKMVSSYKKDIDLHVTTATLMFPDFDTRTVEEQEKLRGLGKTKNFASVYSLNEEYLAMYPGLQNWVEETIEFLKENCFTYNLFNRRRRLPSVLTPKDDWDLKHIIQQGVNARIQGGAHDLTTKAAIAVYKEFRRFNLKSHIILEVHDSLIVDTHPVEVDIVTQILYNKMVEGNVLNVPLKVDVKKGKCWGKLKKVEVNNE